MSLEKPGQIFIQNQRCCDICAAPLAYSEFAAQKVAALLLCHSSICKQVVLDGKRLAPHQFEFHIRQHKKRLKEQREKVLDKQIYTKKVIEKESKENRAILDAVMNSHAAYSEGMIYTISIPGGCTEMVKRKKTKLDGYISNLKGIIRDAFSVELDDDAKMDGDYSLSHAVFDVPKGTGTSPKYDTVNTRVCGACKGGCCAQGGNHAYIDVATIIRIRRRHPEITPEDMLNEYLSRLGPESVENGCINQTDCGCVLPREWRANICNTYFCSGMRRLHEHMESRGSITPILAIRRSNNNFNVFDPAFDNKILGTVFIDGDELVDIDCLKIEIS